MTRHRELTELRARCTALIATMEKLAGTAPDFVRRYDRSGHNSEPSFSAVYFAVKALGEIASDEAKEVEP